MSKNIEITFTEEELVRLLEGEEFDWTFSNVDVHLKKDVNEE